MEVGIDIGSISIGAVFVEEDTIVAQHYIPHKGDIINTLRTILKTINHKKVKICITGKNIVSHPNIMHLDPIVALTDGATHLYPDLRHILYIGGESYTLVHIKDKKLQNYLKNCSCASGTGAFLEQQATRLGMNIDEFSKQAEKYNHVPPRVATRCAVFAKSDIIHLQQGGTSVEAIAAGLCDSLVDGLVESLFKGEKLKGQTAIAGGVALNDRVVKSLSKHLEELVPRDYSTVLGAYGSALHAKKTKSIDPFILLEGKLLRDEHTREPLKIQKSNYPDFASYISQSLYNTEITLYKELVSQNDVYLGIDIGSTSTKASIISIDGDILVGFYTRTGGKPVDAVKDILRCIRSLEQKEDIRFHFCGVGTTGSGRKLIKNVLTADIEVNEITAHATAAVGLYPEVDTIIEIGGQDAKFTRISNASVSNAVMNYVCAAGTGSFIEEQAKRLDISLKDFSEFAMRGKAPITSERCTVYMERDINRLIRQGWKSEDIAAAVIFSVRDNYLNKVVAGAPIGNHILFQGATARNQALVAAFEEQLRKEIKVFPYAHLTGAIGICYILKKNGQKKSSFKGLSFIDTPVILDTETCELCNNNCKLTVIKTPEGKDAYGLMCGRDYEDNKFVATKKDYFDFLHHYKKTKLGKGTVIIPCALAMFEYVSLWKSFFQKLGFKVKITKTSQKSFEKGKQIARAEFCAPLLTAQGLVWEAAKQDADMVFFPVFYKEANQEYDRPVSPEGTPSFFCYYTSHLPAIIRTRIADEHKHKLISPVLQMNQNREEIVDELFKYLQKYDLKRENIKIAYEQSYNDYLEGKKVDIAKGNEVIKNIPEGEVGLVIMGRPYGVFDPTMNASLVEKVIGLGHPTIYYDMLDVPENTEDDTLFNRMHWNYGKKIYRAAKYIAESDNLFPIFLTSFHCSPDAFVMTYFKHIMEHFKKPYLIIQLDEHCSDVGYLTRVEAAIDSFKSWIKEEGVTPPTFDMTPPEVSLDKTILVPHVDEISSCLVAAAFRSNGYNALVLEESSATALEGFRHTLGGECMAIPAILGGIIKAVKDHNLEPEKTMVFLPTSYIACNFPQFPVKISMALEKSGMPIKIFDNSDFSIFKRLFFKMDMLLLDALVVSHALRQLSCSIRPYEKNPGDTDAVEKKALSIMEDATSNKRNKTTAWTQVVELFGSVEIEKKTRPKVLITGDLYVRNNDAFNQDVVRKIEELGGEVLTCSNTEYFHYDIELDRYEGEQNLTGMATYYVMKKILDNWEDFYFKPIHHLISHIEEPTWDEIFKALDDMGVDIALHGETAVTVSRARCLAEQNQIQAIVHINPSFCCAGNVSITLLEDIRENYNIPVLNIFYDGTDQPNDSLVPFMHYLCKDEIQEAKEISKAV